MNSVRLEQLKTLLVDNPQDAFLAFATAKEYDKLGLPEKAIFIYLDLIKKQPNYTGTYYHLAQLYVKQNMTVEAERIFRQGMEITLKLGQQHEYNELKGALSLLVDEED